MGTLQRVASSLSANTSSYGGDAAVSDQFPVGLRVLVVDDDTTCLRILEHMLRRQLYQVTSCSQATVALNILRERKGCFDIVLSDVYMPDMDGYKLLEQVGLEMDLPVIMMSADGSKSAVMRGIIHGACDYLIKPIREEEIKNMWQHVIRKKRNEIKEHEHSGSLEDNDQHKRGSDDVDHASSVNEGTEGVLKCQKKRSSGKEEGGSELESDDPSATKKPRVVWSVELHQQFVSAVNQLGIDKAVPKRILELMNVPGLTRENVASHLQKFRLYLKRLSGVAQCGVSSTFCRPLDPNVKLNSLVQFDLQALAASGQIPQQTLAALHAELLGRSTGSLVTVMDQPAPLHASMQASKSMPVEHDVKFGQPLVKCQSNISKHFQQNMPPAREVAPRFGVWSSNSLGPLGPSNNLGGMDTQNCNILMDILQQQKQQRQQLQKQQQRPSLPEPSHSINVQPSCLVVPSQSSSASSQAGNSTASVNQNCSFNGGAIVDYNLLSPQSNSLLNIGNVSDGPIETASVVSGFSVPDSVSPPSSCFINADNGTLQQVQNSTMMFGAARQSLGIASNICDIQGSYSANTGEVLDQGLLKDLGFVGKGTCIPSQFAMNGCESPMSSLNHGKISLEKNVNKVKEEPGVEFLDNARVGLSILPQFPPNDLMDVFSE